MVLYLQFTKNVLCLLYNKFAFKVAQMTTKKFDEMPTATESLNLNDISEESSKQAWAEYETKPEYKVHNKHDMIESLQSCENMNLDQ